MKIYKIKHYGTAEIPESNLLTQDLKNSQFHGGSETKKIVLEKKLLEENMNLLYETKEKDY